MQVKSKLPNFLLAKNGETSNIFRKRNIKNFHTACHWVQQLPYGRISDRSNLLLHFSEYRGACSSKHALLKSCAMEQGQNEIKLVIGIYKMNSRNTPGTATVFHNSKLTYLPEAHCYLQYRENRFDFTFPNKEIKEEKVILQTHPSRPPDGVASSHKSLFSPAQSLLKLGEEILVEKEILPEDILPFKTAFHKDFIRQWILEEKVPLGFEEVWAIREACILALSGG